MKLVKYVSEAWALRKADEYLLDVFQRNWLRIVLCTWLTDRISNSRLYEKGGSIPLTRAIMKERLRWLGHVLRMKDERLPSIVLNGKPSRAKRKVDYPYLRWEDVFKGNRNLLGGCKELINWDGGEACVAVLASGSLVLRWIIIISSSQKIYKKKKKVTISRKKNILKIRNLQLNCTTLKDCFVRKFSSLLSLIHNYLKMMPENFETSISDFSNNLLVC